MQRKFGTWFSIGHVWNGSAFSSYWLWWYSYLVGFGSSTTQFQEAKVSGSYLNGVSVEYLDQWEEQKDFQQQTKFQQPIYMFALIKAKLPMRVRLVEGMSSLSSSSLSAINSNPGVDPKIVEAHYSTLLEVHNCLFTTSLYKSLFGSRN